VFLSRMFFRFPRISRITLMDEGLRGEVIIGFDSVILCDTHCSGFFVFSTDEHG